jgi:7-cyano-7-deazaguanine synthase
MTNKRGAVVIHSGGLDSTVLLAQVIDSEKYEEVVAIHFNYGQRHATELSYARRLCEVYGVKDVTIEIGPECHGEGGWMRGSSQTDYSIDVPVGHYADESMRKTVVPNRNMIMIACAASLAESLGFDTVYYGAHSGDHAIYPDCRWLFVTAMQEALRESTYPEKVVRLEAPFLYMSKAEIVADGRRLHVPFHLTYSCYAGRSTHCGQCGTCVERREAFQLAGIRDPTQYERTPDLPSADQSQMTPASACTAPCDGASEEVEPGELGESESEAF